MPVSLPLSARGRAPVDEKIRDVDDSLQLLMEMAESMERGTVSTVHPRPDAGGSAGSSQDVFVAHASSALTGATARMAEPDRGQLQREGSHRDVPDGGLRQMTVAEVVQEGCRRRLDSWREIELLLRDDSYSFLERPAVCKWEWGVYRESPKISRRGKKGTQRDLWTNSGGVRGATLYPPAESNIPSRVRRQYGRIARADKKGGRELKFLEYSLVDNPHSPLSPELLQRRLFQTLPVIGRGTSERVPRPLRAAIESTSSDEKAGSCDKSEPKRTARTKFAPVVVSNVDVDTLAAETALALLQGKPAGAFGDGSKLPRRPQNLSDALLAKRDRGEGALLYKEDRRIGFARRQAMRDKAGGRSADRWKNLGT